MQPDPCCGRTLTFCDLQEQEYPAADLDLEKSSPAFARFAKSMRISLCFLVHANFSTGPRLLMAILPSVIRSDSEKAPEILLNISEPVPVIAFPSFADAKV